MKKNMVPLLAIAFVVAIISTGVFYGLFAGRLRSTTGEMITQPVVVAARHLDRGSAIEASDVRISEARMPVGMKGTLLKTDDVVGATLLDSVKEGEPITQLRLASRESSEVPKGMRAVSIRVTDSTGLVSAIRPGARVDVQAVYGRDTTFQVRTILQNVEILNVSPRTESREGSALPVATVLIPPQEEDALALADSGAHVRLALRNAQDAEVIPARPAALASLFQAGAKPAPVSFHETTEVHPQPRPASVSQAVPLSVWVIGASAAALRDIDAKLSRTRSGESVQVASFRDQSSAEELVHHLASQRELEILSSTRLTAGTRQPGILSAGGGEGHLRIQFRAVEQGGRSSLRLKPEISWKRVEGGIESRSFEAEAPGGTDFLVSGLLRIPSDSAVLDRLFPGRSWSGRELLIIVSAQHSKPVQTAALVKPGRRH
jgi:Flp pilus assembly protein CpaB